jgi:hypothetical protein
MALHCFGFLVHETPVLGRREDFIDLRFQTTHASHRMQKDRQTVVHPLATSDHDERRNRKVLDDLLLNQLKMEKVEVNRLMVSKNCA